MSKRACPSHNESKYLPTPHPITRLPTELLGHTFSCLCDKDEWSAALTCRLWMIASLSFGRKNAGNPLLRVCGRLDETRYNKYPRDRTVIVYIIGILNTACERGFTSLMRQFVEQSTLTCIYKDVLGFACIGGHLPLVQWLVTRGAPIIRQTLNSACKGGHLPIVQWLVTQGALVTKWTLISACEGGHLPLVQWLVAHRAPVSESALRKACRGGHLRLAQWLVTQGAPVTEWSLESACHGGHTSLARWLVAIGAPVTEWTVANARNGRYATRFKWLTTST